jgi:hypothetical protein
MTPNRFAISIVRICCVLQFIATAAGMFFSGCSEFNIAGRVIASIIASLPFSGPFLLSLWRTNRRLSWFAGSAVLIPVLSVALTYRATFFELDPPIRFLHLVRAFWLAEVLIPVVGLAILVSTRNRDRLNFVSGVWKVGMYVLACFLTVVFLVGTPFRVRRGANELSAVGHLGTIRDCFSKGEGEACAQNLMNPRSGYQFYWKASDGAFQEAHARPLSFDCSGEASYLMDDTGTIHLVRADREATRADEVLQLPSR